MFKLSSLSIAEWQLKPQLTVCEVPQLEANSKDRHSDKKRVCPAGKHRSARVQACQEASGTSKHNLLFVPAGHGARPSPGCLLNGDGRIPVYEVR
ncbi:MAG: hypothetical protein FRX49_03488 [Trebouxia sp. A1-2]|nr:MAG: hypothetical protein FRX49_03488 [Trebouxia sp. A1-2]